jgi:arylsulfatase A-like enzyme
MLLCSLAGKWHLGHADVHNPSFRGFDMTYSLPWSVDMGCVDGGGTDLPDLPLCPHDKASAAVRMFDSQYAHKNPWPKNDWPALPLYDSPLPQCRYSEEQDAREVDVATLTEEVLHEEANRHIHVRANRKLREAGPKPKRSRSPPSAERRAGTAACNRRIVEQPVNITTLSDNYIIRQWQFIDGAVARQKEQKARGDDITPFFLYIPLSHMHVPLSSDPRWVNQSTSKSVYGDTLLELDWQVQNVLLALREHGIEEETLVIYTSDNGPWEAKCQYAGSLGPYTGEWMRNQEPKGQGTGKFTKSVAPCGQTFAPHTHFILHWIACSLPLLCSLCISLCSWEGGHRMPMIAYMPGKIAPGVSSALASSLDIVPTFLALAGYPLPTDRSFDGLDLSPVLFGGATQHHP